MPVWETQELDFDVDAILRGQGAEPGAIRARNPRLVELASRALDEARPLLEPVTVYRELNVEVLRHERLVLADG